MEEFVEVLGCKLGSLPSTYLGLPLGAPYNSRRVWEGVEERFQKRLALWKKQYLSKGGRWTLIKSALSNLPICFMSLFVIPKRVAARLEKIQSDFLWEEGGWRKSLIWLIGRLCVWRSKMGVWVLEAFLSSIRHFWVNGLGDLRSKGTLFGNR